MISLIFWLAVIPYCIGLIPTRFLSENKRSAGVTILAGYFAMWALFEVIAVPAVIFVEYHNFRTASAWFMACSLLCAAVGLGFAFVPRAARRMRNGEAAECGTGVAELRKYAGRLSAGVRTMPWAERIEWLLFLALLGFQLYRAAAYTSFDGDDAYYVVESLIAQQAEVMYRILPYTGRPTYLDVRHALAVFPMWIAFVAERSGIHATVLSHLVMPFVLIPLTYLVYYEIGRLLFGRAGGLAAKETDDGLFCRENLPVFMILMAVFQIFGNVSIYTNETFFLTRTWQGKAVAGSLVIPALFWIFLQTGGGMKRGRRTDAGVWALFVCINMTAGICSSIAVFLISILTAVTALCLAVVERDLRVLLKMGAACVPNVIYMAVYVVIAYSYLWR